ncbi:hypothetical protein MXB_4511, partial [Myxobolus squamalis]
FAIEGNISCGKTTLMQYMKEKYPEIDIILEPWDEWNNVHGYKFWDMYLDEPKRWSLAFQTNVISKMMEDLQRISSGDKSEEKKTTLMERSIYSSCYVFGSFLHAMYEKKLLIRGNMHDLEFDILKRMIKVIGANRINKLDGIIYLRSTPESCFRRLEYNKTLREKYSLVRLLLCCNQKSLVLLHDFIENMFEKKISEVSLSLHIIDVIDNLPEMKIVYDTTLPAILNLSQA